MGFAQIVNGKFDTRDEDKGPVPGPVRVKVIGFVSNEPFAAALFPHHVIEVEITESSRSFDIDVPAKSPK